jgi:hypothetical protein
MSRMGNFVMSMEEFTVAAENVFDKAQLLALAEMYFDDDNEIAYAMSIYNPSRYRGMSYAQIISELRQAGME